MNIYISGIGNISAGSPFDNDFQNNKAINDSRILHPVEPQYKDYIDPKISRRLSRIIKMGLASAKMALNDASVDIPDGIITGTAIGCIEDTEKFLNSVIEGHEELPSPSAFISSTHNSISSQIAIALKCHGYNSTFSSRGFSFESALMDAMMQIDEKPGLKFLAGSVDELTDKLADILENFEITFNLNLNKNKFPYGEGAAFFLLSGEKKNMRYGKISSVKMIYNNSDENILDVIENYYNDNKTFKDKTDLVLFGGEIDEVIPVSNIFADCGVILFKKYCGEYFTSTSYALYFACMLLKNGLKNISFDAGNSTTVSKIVLINKFNNKYYSFVTVEND